jgi:hypothetical protein
VKELFTGTAFGADIQPALCAGSGFFACAVAIGIAASGAIIGELEIITQGGGGHAALPSAPPALLGAQIAQQLARNGFTPQYNVYDWPSPGTHFDPRVRITDPEPPLPSGKTGQPQYRSAGGVSHLSFSTCLGVTVTLLLRQRLGA